MKNIFKDKKKSKKKTSIVLPIIMGIFMTILLYFYIGDIFESNSWLYCGAIGIGITIILYILERVGIIKTKSEEEKELEKQQKKLEKERIKEEEKQIDLLEFKDLANKINKEENKLDYMRSSLKERKEYKRANWVWDFVSFGLVVFFMALLFFGSLDGVYLDRTIYVEKVESAFNVAIESLVAVVNLVMNSFSDLVIKFYDFGATNPKVFFILWFIICIWWIGYMFIYQLFKQDYFIIKDFVIPFFKKIFKKQKGGQK